MTFLLAPDKYKGSLTGAQFCKAVAEGILMALPQAKILNKPLADGGDGTLEVIAQYLNAEKVTVTVHDPLFRKIRVAYLYDAARQLAFMEMADASGYKLLAPEELSCWHTSSLGTGEMLVDALKRGAKEIVLGIGGSATNDGGMGVASAFGYRFLDREGQTLSPVGKNLGKVHEIIKPCGKPIWEQVKIKVACDVGNPFYGPQGAAHVYAAQKGASPKTIVELDEGLQRLANRIQASFSLDVQQVKGAGAAGGLGGGMVALLNATLCPGIDLVMEIARFKEALTGVDWIVTGEGKLDAQTLSGKTMAGVLHEARKHNIPVAALCGAVLLSPKEQKEFGLAYAVSILHNIGSLEDAKQASYNNLVAAAYNFASLVKG